MSTEHPITPPPELVGQWQDESPETQIADHIQYLATRAAQWGADQELEACLRHLDAKGHHPTVLDALRAARRPKPPSAVAQAETLIERHEDGWVPSPAQWHTIREGLAEGRRALEALPND